MSGYFLISAAAATSKQPDTFFRGNYHYSGNCFYGAHRRKKFFLYKFSGIFFSFSLSLDHSHISDFIVDIKNKVFNTTRPTLLSDALCDLIDSHNVCLLKTKMIKILYGIWNIINSNFLINYGLRSSTRTNLCQPKHTPLYGLCLITTTHPNPPSMGKEIFLILSYITRNSNKPIFYEYGKPSTYNGLSS